MIWHRADPVPDHRGRVGFRLRRHLECRRPVRELPAPQGRRTIRAQRHPDGPGDGLPAAPRGAGIGMSIRLRLAVVFAVASAILFALGSWLFVAELSSSLLGSIDSQLAVQLGQAARYLPASGGPGSGPATGIPAPGEYIVQIIDSASH